MSENKLQAPQINYARYDTILPKYRFTLVKPLSGNQTVNIQNASTSEVLMEIPTQVCNLSQSYLSGTMVITNQTQLAGGTCVAWWHMLGLPMLQEVDFYTRSGLYLLQLQNAHKYGRIVRPYNTSYKEFMSNDYSSFCAPCNQFNYNNSQLQVTPSNGNVANYLAEPLYCDVGPYGGSGAVATSNVPFNIPLSAIKQTILAMDKDMVFPEIMVLRLLFQQANKMAWKSTDIADPTAGAVPLPATDTIVINNLTLYLAVEKNPVIADACRALVNSPAGMNILIPFPIVQLTNLGTTSQPALSYRFNRGMGVNLLETYLCAFNSTETGNVAMECFNAYGPLANAGVAGIYNMSGTNLKVLNLYSQIDNLRMQDVTPNCAGNYQDDYREVHKLMKDCAIQNIGGYWNNWVFWEKFYDEAQSEQAKDIGVDEVNKQKGLSLIVERKQDYFITTNNLNLNWYQFFIVQKDVHIGADRIAFQ